MGALRLAALLELAVAPLPATAQGAADPVARWRADIAEASARFGIPESWIVRVMRAESGGRTMLNGRPIRSPAGAMGLMQLMPATWAETRATYNLGADPDDPRANILAGTAYLRRMYDRFGYPGMFAAYNAGPGRYAAYLADQARLPRETTGYLAAVAGDARTMPHRALSAAREAVEPPRQSLFVVRSGGAESGGQAADSTARNGLFFVRGGER